MQTIKKYPHGGVHYDLPKTKKETRVEKRQQKKEDREDKKGMIPARFRNRGQKGLDKAIAHLQKKAKGARDKKIRVAKRQNKNGPIQKIVKGLRAKRSAKQNEKAVSGSASGSGSGNCNSKGCSALGKPK